MDIKNLNSNLVQNRSPEPVKTASKDATENKSTTDTDFQSKTDKVTITHAFSQVSNLEQKALGVDIDNTARIAELKSAIQDGSYQANPERIADKLMQTEALFARF